MTELPKTFDPAEIEARWYARWENEGLFRPARPEAEPFTIVIPPPNVTGSLHIGHALDITLQDVLVRHARLQGKDALWVVGTDHAGIATQMVVERTIAGQGLTRQELGREKFLDIVWDWKGTSGGAITRQLRRLGASCDWANERFTMDPGFPAAVTKVFVQLFREGLLYRDKRLVNWDPKFQTAISDLEVETKEVQGRFWHLRYPFEDGSGFIRVATTRPETMLADMAVAVHPEDGRYRGAVGKKLRHPITGRLIPVIADEHADPELGSGAVKITPGHDFNDFEVGKRAGIRPAEMLNMLDAEARVAQTADGLVPDDLVGVDRFEARKLVVERLEAEGLIERVEERVVQVPHGDRSGAVIEPWLTDQWYVDAATLAKPAITAVRSGATTFEPAHWAKTCFEWMRNIEPWCVSRQLWWGHRIPAWYGPDGQVFVELSEEEAKAAALKAYGREEELRQDEDVLDTWFSSGLWPFSTLGWPDETSDLKRFYPTTDLVTGFDIIFFWVARMMMLGIHFMGEVPFKRVVINGLVRDAKGQKMSKSKGNVIDPLEVIDDLGADALRFTMAILSGTRDIKLSRERIEGYRNFGTKLWNAARFCQMNECQRVAAFDPGTAQQTINRWIRGEAAKTCAEVTSALDAAHFDEAAQGLYRFVWNVF